MVPNSGLWAVFTIAAAGAQTSRNAMQRELVETVGLAGATYVRFLYGLPFAAVFLAGACLASGHPPDPISLVAFALTALGAVAQILATGSMLAAMRDRSFVATIAYTKTEPILVALFGLIALGDRVSALGALAIIVATIGVVLLSWPKGSKARDERDNAGLRPAALGLGAAAGFALSAVGYRAGILALGGPSFLLGASTILVLALLIQSALIIGHLALFDRPLLKNLLVAWRPSLFAGLMGACASQLWFLALALETAARVRALGLVEVVFAQIVTRRIFKQAPSWRELGAIALIVLGVALLLAA
nr:DMT family transporter [Methylocapsa acidiphila]